MRKEYEQYRINKDTLAMIPIDKVTTKIYETNDVIIIKRNIQKLIEENC